MPVGIIEGRKQMKRIMLLMVVATIVLSGVVVCEAKAEKTDWQIAKQLCHNFGYKKIRIIETNKLYDKELWTIIENRKSENVIYVEKVVSIADGTTHGWYKTPDDEYIIGYNKQVEAGRKVTSYVIWNPKTNYEDDVLYVVDNKTYR